MASTFAQPPDRGVASVLQPPVAVSAITPPVRSSQVWRSPPGSAEPYQEDPRRLTQLITAMPGSRPRAGTIPKTAAGFCVGLCSTRPGIPAPWFLSSFFFPFLSFPFFF